MEFSFLVQTAVFRGMKAHFHIQDKIFCCRTNIYFYGEEILCLFGWIETYPGSFGTSSVSPSTAITEFSIFRETRPKISKISEISKDLLKTPISRWSLICPKSPSLHPPEIFAPQRGDFLHKIGFLSLFSLTTMVVNPPLLYDSLFFFLFFYPR